MTGRYDYSEDSDECIYGHHVACTGHDGHLCMCMCHVMDVGQRFLVRGMTWEKTGPTTFRLLGVSSERPTPPGGG